MMMGAVVCLLAAISVIMIEGAPRFGLREAPSEP
jgi:hypothetical protein